ncbi:MAG: hypothetical protein ACYCO3_10510, partial [Mycobacteriales bacterium]
GQRRVTGRGDFGVRSGGLDSVGSKGIRRGWVPISPALPADLGLNEPQRRVVVGAMAVGLERGGKSAVAGASRMSRNTVIKAEREVIARIEPPTRQR